MSRFKGFVGLPGYAIIVGFVAGIMLTVFLYFGAVASIKSTVELTLQSNDNGGRLNALLSESDSHSILERITSYRAKGYTESVIQEKLSRIGWNAVLADSQDNTLKEFGRVRPQLGFFVDVPLPGGGQGRAGVDST